MTRNRPLPELLAPAGSEAAFTAALSAGADAVYLGVRQFNARAFAENFDDETLARCLREAHARGVRVYVTMNTLLTDRELEEAFTCAVRLREMGVDALIVADVGLAAVCRGKLPDFPLHASTQLSLHSSDGVREMGDLAFEEAVLARELSLDNIASAVRDTDTEIEGFLHGALCVCHSGQCLFSALVGGRSGNRGMCAQPCRLPYHGGYVLSLRDLCLAGHIRELIATGISSLKIEGRMKSPAYVYGVTRIYRRLLDEGRDATPEEMRELARIFSRGGFTDGYLTGHLADGMTGVRSETDKQNSREETVMIPPPAPVALRADCRIAAGEPATLTLTDPRGRQVTVEGDVPEAARSAPLTEAGVRERLGKLGNTPYRIEPEAIDLTLGAGLNLSPAQLNALRRRAVSALTDPQRDASAPAFTEPESPAFAGPDTTCLFFDPAVWEAVADDCRDMTVFLPLWRLGETNRTPQGVWLPPVIPDDEARETVRLLEEARGRGIRWALCGNPGQIALARRAGMQVMGDFRLNVTNRAAAGYWQSHGVRDAVLSPELTLPQLRDVGGRVIAWGRIPLMLTERCFARDIGGCARCGKVKLTDRRGVSFPIVRVPRHRNLILNSIPTYLGDRRDRMPQGIRYHLLFTVEDAGEAREVLTAWRAGVSLAREVRRLPKQFGTQPTR